MQIGGKKLENAKCKLEEKIAKCEMEEKIAECRMQIGGKNWRMQNGGKNWRMQNANWRKPEENSRCQLHTHHFHPGNQALVSLP